MKIPYTNILRILKEEIEYKKIFFKWVPYKLNDGIKKQRIEKAQKMLDILNNRKKYPWNSIVTGDESWICHYYPPDS